MNTLNRLALGLICFLTAGISVCTAKTVVVYTSVDQIFSEPILKAYEKKTGVDLKAVYDVEASKTTGLVNRLIAEKKRPKCDVFWNGEIGKTLELKAQGVLAPYPSPSAKGIPAQFVDTDHYWTGFGARARVLVYNTRMLSGPDLPESIFELTRPEWKGRVAMAYPLFGTTATHMAALYCSLGEQKTRDYLSALKNNDVVIVDGNSVVRDLVAQGRLPIGLTDTDDVNVALESGKPVGMIYPDKGGLGTLLIPNTVALIKGGPNAAEGKRFIDYLLSPEVEGRLSFSGSAQMPLRNGIETPPHVPEYRTITPMAVDYVKVGTRMRPAADYCRRLFIR